MNNIIKFLGDVLFSVIKILGSFAILLVQVAIPAGFIKLAAVRFGINIDFAGIMFALLALMTIKIFVLGNNEEN